MKLKFIVLFMLSPALLASNFTAKLNNGKKYSCKSDSESNQIFHCKYKNEVLLIKNDPVFPAGISKVDGRVRAANIDEIKDEDGKVIFKANNFFIGFNDDGKPKTSFNSAIDANSSYINLKFLMKTIKDKSSEGFKLASDLSLSAEAEIRYHNLNFNADNFKVKLANGKEAKCKREKSTQTGLLDEESRYMYTPGTDKKCRVLNCGSIDGADIFIQLTPDISTNNHAVIAIKDNEFHGKNGLSTMHSESGKILFENRNKDEFNYEVISSNPYYAFESEFGFKYCNSKIKEKFSKALMSKKNQTRKKELKQVVTYAHELLQTSLVPLDQPFEVECIQGGVYYQTLKAYNETTKLQEEPLQSETTISLAKAQELLDQALGMEDIAWNYVSDGCYARAHLMAERFKEQGVDVNKAWVNGKLQYTKPDGKEINWNYHVAPSVKVKGPDGKIEHYVIDPSVSKTPLKAEDWVMKISKDKEDRIEKVVFPFPQNSASFHRNSLAFSRAEEYYPQGNNDQWDEAQKIQMARSTMSNYLKAEDMPTPSALLNPYEDVR